MNDHISRPAARSAFASLAGAFVPASQESRVNQTSQGTAGQASSASSTIWLSPFGETSSQPPLHRGTRR